MKADLSDFEKYWICTLATHDCDPAIYVMKYIVSRMELNIEQRYWLCFLYANTYQLPTAWVLFNEFPDFENVDYERLYDWNNKNYSKLKYQTDQKWLKGHLPQIFDSYRKMVEPFKTQHFMFNSFGLVGKPDFERAYKYIIKHQYKFGRYTTWFYLQSIKEICGIDFQPDNLLLSDDGSSSHRAGLCHATGRHEWAEKGYKFTSDQIAELESDAKVILNNVKRYQKNLLGTVDFFTMETALCAFKKLYRVRDGRYLGYYLDRFAEDIVKVEESNWPGINWKLFWDSRSEILHPELVSKYNTSDKSKMKLYTEIGRFCHDQTLVERILENVTKI